MAKPLFSIITITYNAEKVLEETMRSVLMQSSSNYEYIIIDGASKDKTVDIIKQYKDSITYWISEPDKGLYDAMNKGLLAAKGEYVWFLNAGDTLYSLDLLRNLGDRISKLPASPDVLYGDTALVDSHGKFVSMRRLRPPRKLTWKSFRMGMLVCHQSFVAKRSIAPNYDLSYRFSSDFDWCIKCLKAAKTVFNTHSILTNYLDEGVTTQNMKASLKERFEIMKKFYGIIPTYIIHGWFAVRFLFAKHVKKQL